LWLAETSQQPISHTTWLKVTQYYNYCNITILYMLYIRSLAVARLDWWLYLYLCNQYFSSMNKLLFMSTCRDYKRRIRWKKQHNQPFAELQQQYNNTPPTAGWGKNNLKKRKQMRRLDSLTLAAQRCTDWWLRLNVLTSLPFLLSHGLSTFNHILCNPKKVLLTYYLDNLIYLHSISYSVANCGLDKFFLLTLQSHPVLVEGTETWTLPFNIAMSEHLCTSYPPYILWLPLSKKTFKHVRAVQPRFWSVLYFFYQARRENNSGWSW
jgi:hypothetical protein